MTRPGYDKNKKGRLVNLRNFPDEVQYIWDELKSILIIMHELSEDKVEKSELAEYIKSVESRKYVEKSEISRILDDYAVQLKDPAVVELAEALSLHLEESKRVDVLAALAVLEGRCSEKVVKSEAIETADATSAEETMALVNELKAKINSMNS